MTNTLHGKPKTVVMERVIEALQGLSDPEFQRRVWIEGSPTEVSSMDEVTAALIDDSGLGVALEKNEITFSREIDQELRDLRTQLHQFVWKAHDLSGKELHSLLETPKWLAIQKKAAHLLKSLGSFA